LEVSLALGEISLAFDEAEPPGDWLFLEDWVSVEAV
jgi:hypothetical protein